MNLVRLSTAGADTTCTVVKIDLFSVSSVIFCAAHAFSEKSS